MAEEISDVLLAISILALVLLVIYLYIASVSKALKAAGLTEGEASTIVFVTLFLGWVTIPIFPYNGWWVGISIGGGLIPLILCAYFLKTGRATPAESVIGIAIVAYLTYSITRAEEGVGIVADVPVAFAPAVAAGLYSLSVFLAGPQEGGSARVRVRDHRLVGGGGCLPSRRGPGVRGTL